jgi:hypothetical protein
VTINGFAGMLTYNDSVSSANTENVRLYYSSDGGSTFNFADGITQSTDADPLPAAGNDNTFGTVGLSLLDGLSFKADVVRFKAFGTGTFDDGNANVTAAALDVSQVPVPAALPLLLAGFGALGVVARRKKRAAA